MENDSALRESVYNQILKINEAKGVYELFRILGYPESSILDLSSRRKKSTFEFKKEDNERITEIYSVLNLDDKLPVFLLETTTLSPSVIRSVTSTFDRQYIQYLLIFTIDYGELTFVFPDKEKVEAGKHKLKLIKLNSVKEDIKTKKFYYSVIETLANLSYENQATWREVWRNWKKAFSVERVTEAFFEDYKEVFFKLRSELHEQRIPSKESHEFTLQFLNRIMFIYFISKKDWLEEPKFVDWLWSKYIGLGKYNSNEFYEKWLKQVFLKAFNNRENEIKGLPDSVIRVISNAPYLNGGLFRENRLDGYKILITDMIFQKILKFFESYNFTIKEDMPLESEIAVDPQMIGYVYESLANVAEEIYDRNDLGIFYTPRVEVDFMCRRSLVEYLSKNLAEIPKEKFYHLIFDPVEERDKIVEWFTKNQQWRRLEDILNGLSVVDPSCGSGAFLVGMLNVVSDLYRIIYKHLGNSISDFALKNRVIEYSLYGVDVMPWAIHAAELRLWLQLIVDTEFKKEDLRQYPLLPNLNLNLRVGDSLVQEIGGISFNLRNNNLKTHLKRKLEELKQEKRKYFENSPTAKFNTPEEVKKEEIRLFEEIIDERVESLTNEIRVYEHEIEMAGYQKTLVGELVIDEKKVKMIWTKIEISREEMSKLRGVKDLLNDPERKPFVWDIDFAEIFADRGGFDIVIGNPPYVTRTNISPPNMSKKEASKKERDEYKSKLSDSLKNLFPQITKIGTMLDLYVYFYFQGMALINSYGTFSFITSNSWLNVGFGETLRDFLAKFGNGVEIFDTRKRVFDHAKINTVIVFLSKPEAFRTLEEESVPKNRNIVKFILFKGGFELANTRNNLIIAENETNVSDGDLSLFAIQQDKLGKNFNGKLTETEKVIRENWSLFRAPDVFFKVIEKDRIRQLSKVSRVKVGYRTGANDFYYLSKKEASEKGIEEEFLKPIVTTPKECKNILLSSDKLPYLVFICDKSKSELYDTYALKYIEEAEKKEIEVKKGPDKGKKLRGYQNLELIRLSGRRNWYSLGETVPPYILVPLIYYKRPVVCINNNALNDVNMVGIHPFEEYKSERLALSLLSTFSLLNYELFGISNLGEGSLKLNPSYIEKCRIFDPKFLSIHEGILTKFAQREFRDVFEEIGIDSSMSIRDQDPVPLQDRGELDNIIFDELGLTQDERKEVYWSVCELVKQRIDKARSLRD